MSNISITYVSNAGVLVNLAGKKILIDALSKSRLPIFRNTPPDISEKIIRNIPPYDHIDIILITHNHRDHFDPKMMCEFLEYNDNTVVISTQCVISDIRSCIPNARDPRLIEVNPYLHGAEKIKVKEIDIHAISMTHDGKEYVDVKNLAFLIGYGRTILHIGDAAPTKNNFQVFHPPLTDIDLLIANFPYVGLPAARQIVKNYINPKKIAVVHLPIPEQDRFGWIKATKKSYERVKGSFYPTVFLEEVGSKIMV